RAPSPDSGETGMWSVLRVSSGGLYVAAPSSVKSVGYLNVLRGRTRPARSVCLLCEVIESQTLSDADRPPFPLPRSGAEDRARARYFTITPQARRPPLLPVGSVFSSSRAAWTIRLVPPG